MDWKKRISLYKKLRSDGFSEEETSSMVKMFAKDYIKIMEVKPETSLWNEKQILEKTT